MPGTINGIGTHYYGKKNLHVRTAICGACQRQGNLSSYDTRLWFVVVFIPIIPLGRKRIIDQCPSCTRHRVADADAFEQAKQLQISAGLDQYRRQPSADSAIGLHAQLLAFHEIDQAADFRRTALERFPRHAGLRVGLAHQLEDASEYAEASGLYEAALGLEPDLPAARTGVAFRKMANGDLDEARVLLNFAEVPGAGGEHNLAPIDILAGHYQRAGRHRETLELAAHLLRELPEIGRQHAFRAFVGRSEKALGVTESILPERKHSVRGLFRAEGSEYPAWQRWAMIGGLGLGLLTIGLAANNEYIRRHRVLNVVNACGVPVEVSLDGGAARTLSNRGTIPIAEGKHRLRITGPVDQTVDVDLEASYWDRWFKKPVWVLNPGDEAVLDQKSIYYAKNPRPSTHRLIVGAPFTAFPHIDYPFESPPESIEGTSRALRSRRPSWSGPRGTTPKRSWRLWPRTVSPHRPLANVGSAVVRFRMNS
ncbi:Flp pilus assembly protein TadD, contains TPR repeats [Singulisphaera sp. GP187]|uniref:hypothetical protein n=1 Tax=Singulisphaera sp. GP187 TaxID=1882752 RepID=UPI000926EE3F|nr:hypothetical protein [Singulisphaera sp. GP187]SIO67937.1 Flp pilus assembly protein TadD, contains TPR repeats [Singulisphaera sp. GP187]